MNPTDPHAAILLPREPRRLSPRRLKLAKYLAEGWIRCVSCRGHIGKTQYGTPCKRCAGEGWVKR